MNYLTILFLPVLVHIAYSDFKYRKISLITLFLFMVLSIIRFINEMQVNQLITTVVLNCMCILILAGVLVLYSLIRKKNFSSLIGLGDILFIIVTTINFAPLFFLLFIIISSLSGLILFILSGKIKNKNVPFAGIMACVMAVFLSLEQFGLLSCYNDSIMFRFLN